MRMPLTVWGLWLTSILNVLFVPVLGAGDGAAVLRPRVRHPVLHRRRTIRGGGDPILYQHLFWIFGHPEVYILILPAWGIVGDLLSFFARKPAYGYRGTVCVADRGHRAVGGGLRPPHVHDRHEPAARRELHAADADHLRAGRAAVPQLAAHHVERRRALTTPMLFCVGMVFVFGLGGLTGLFLADISPTSTCTTPCSSSATST